MSSALVTPVDLTEPLPEQACDLGCGRPAVYLARGCMDKQPVHMCKPCLERGLDLIRKTVHMYHKHAKRVMICGDCYRPLLTLETHLEVREL
jgi:hypothetical protein